MAAWVFSQFKEWADGVDRKLNIILLDAKKKPIDDTLARAINRAWALARRVDLKVPDTEKQQERKED